MRGVDRGRGQAGARGVFITQGALADAAGEGGGSQREGLAGTRRERQAALPAAGQGEFADALDSCGGAVAQELEIAALHVQAGGGPELDVVVRGVVETKGAFTDDGVAGRGQSAIVAGEGDEARTPLVQGGRTRRTQRREDRPAMQVDVAAGHREQASAEDVGDAGQGTLTEDEPGGRHGEALHVEDDLVAIGGLTKEQAVERRRSRRVIGFEDDPGAGAHVDRRIGAGAEGEHARGSQPQHGAGIPHEQVVRDVDRGARKTPSAAVHRHVGGRPDRIREGDAASKRSGRTRKSVERQLDAVGIESRELDRPREGDRGAARAAGGEQTRAAVEAHEARGRLGDGTGEPESAADQSDLVAGTERVGRPGVRHGREEELAAGDGDVAAERVRPRQHHVTVGLVPAALVVVDHEGAAAAAGNDARQGQPTARAGAGSGDAGGAAERHVTGEREGGENTIAQVSTEGRAGAKADGAGERDRKAVGDGGGDIVDVKFRDGGRRQADAVRGSPGLAVLSLPRDLAEHHLQRA